MSLSYESSTWLWLGSKRRLTRSSAPRPVLSVGYAWALLDGGELETSEARLQDAERWLDVPTDKMVVVDKEEFRRDRLRSPLPELYRSLALGDVPGTVSMPSRRSNSPPQMTRPGTTRRSRSGLAQYTSGDLEAAERSLVDIDQPPAETLAKSRPRSASHFSSLTSGWRWSCLHEAESVYQESLRLATRQGEPMPLGTVLVSWPW